MQRATNGKHGAGERGIGAEGKGGRERKSKVAGKRTRQRTEKPKHRHSREHGNNTNIRTKEM
jgi:hypothetical protein